jgi:hypothetical protein
VCIRKATSDHYIAKRRSNTHSAVKQENDLHVGHDGSCFFAASITPPPIIKVYACLRAALCDGRHKHVTTREETIADFKR